LKYIGKILKNVDNQTLQPMTCIVGKMYYGSQWLLSTVWLPTFFKIYYFVFNRRKKLISVWSKKKGVAS